MSLISLKITYITWAWYIQFIMSVTLYDLKTTILSKPIFCLWSSVWHSNDRPQKKKIENVKTYEHTWYEKMITSLTIELKILTSVALWLLINKKKFFANAWACLVPGKYGWAEIRNPTSFNITDVPNHSLFSYQSLVPEFYISIISFIKLTKTLDFSSAHEVKKNFGVDMFLQLFLR